MYQRTTNSNIHRNSKKSVKTKRMEKLMLWAGRVLAFGCVVCMLGILGSLYQKSVQAEGKPTGSANQLQILDETILSGSEPGSTADSKEMSESTTADAKRTDAESGDANIAAEWPLLLVNPWNTIPEGYADTIRLTELINGQSVDQRCYPDLQAMMDDCRAAGYSPYICSSYRSQAKQTSLFEHNVSALMQAGYSEEDARTETARNVAKPGTSEHQLGLAVDIVDKNYQVLDEAQEDTAVQKWLMENSWRYGFILRYPTDKSDITGIVYEPWHYRYVGKKAAEEIYRDGIVLEEYLERQ